MRYFNYLAVSLLIASIGCADNECSGQTDKPYFKRLTRDQGISSNKINCITQDKFGFIWVGTEDGISRYDGVRFKIYKTEQGLTDNYVNSIACDPDNGDLWIGTRRGICFFNRKEERFSSGLPHVSSVNANLLNSNIFKVFLDSRKCLWIASDSSFYYLDKKIPHSLVSVFRADGTTTREIINDVFEDSGHKIWVGSNVRLYLFNPESKSVIPYSLPEKKLNIRTINEDRRKNLWISTNDHGVFLMKPDGSVLKQYKKGRSLLTNHVTGIAEDERGNIWIGARDGGGLFVFNYNDEAVHFLSGHVNVPGDPYSITSNAITAIYRDQKGYIWVGTYAGLNCYDPYRKKFLHYKVDFRPAGLFNSNIRCFFQDSEGQLWVGTRDGGGISRFEPDKGTFINYRSSSTSSFGLTDGNVLSVTEIDSRRLLIGTNNSGLFIFNKDTEKFTRPQNSSANDLAALRGRIGMVNKDRFGKIWVATTTALYIYDPNTSRFIYNFKLPYVREMLEYNEDEVYIATLFSGIYHYNRRSGRLVQYSNKENTNSLSNDRINSIKKDKRGNLWIATNNGLNYFDTRTKRFKLYTTRDGLPSNIICGILIDSKEDLWLSTVNGLAKFSPVAGKISTFGIYDGLQGTEFEKGVCLLTNSGTMLFGGINGFNYFHPDSITTNPLAPAAVLTDFKIFNKPVAIADHSPLKQSISFEKHITLSHKQSFIEFEFAGLSFTSPEKNQYAYKLEGLEDEWNISSNKTSVSYTGLQPGSYVFRVKAANNDGVWGKQQVALKLDILPPWWQTITFQLLAFFALICSVIWFYRYRTRSLRMQKRKLDILVKERTDVIRQQNKQLAESKDQVVRLNSRIKAISEYRLQYFTNISHEFRTPLTLIISPVNKLLSKKVDREEIEENLLIIKRNAGRLLHLIDELMDFRSLENKNVPLSVKLVHLNALTDEIAGLFKELAREKAITFQVAHGQEHTEGWVDASKLQKVIFNLISNAFNYTGENGAITVRTQLKSGREPVAEEEGIVLGKWIKNARYFEISVSDSGIGIPEESLIKVFKQFYRESITNIDTRGTGLGLSIVKELVQLHKGIIVVKSKVGTGSQFIVQIPLNREIYLPHVDETPGTYDIVYHRGKVLDLLGPSPRLEESAKQSVSEKGKDHILIAEDNEELLDFITRQLSPNYKVTRARNGADGLQAALKYTPDIIVSDVVMPGMTGVEMVKKLKKNNKTAHIPIILLTAKADVESQIEGIEAGADDYISKPFDMDIFKLKIRNLIQSRLKLRKLFSMSAEDIPADAGLNAQDAGFLEKVISIIKANISNPDFNVSQLVDEMCVSPSLLQKKIAKLTNYSPSEFITLYRMKKAVELIRQPGTTVAEVAEMVGFRDPYYFSRCFKKQFGKSPKIFAESLHVEPKA